MSEINEPSEPAADDAAPADEAQAGLQLQLDQAEQQIATLKEQQLRNLAELDNVRKRAAREISTGARFGAERLLRDLLAICDSLELGLKAASESDASAQSIVDGLTLTHRQLIGVLEKHGVIVVDPQGEVFNPEWHEAVAAVPSDTVAPNHVMEVMQKGYRLHERLLRPARVVVAKTTDPAS